MSWQDLHRSGSVYFANSPVTFPSSPSPTNTPLPTHDRKGQLIDRNAPKVSDPQSRSTGVNNGMEHWCSTCQRWGNHLSSDHAEWKQKLKDRRKRNKNGSPESPGVNAGAVTTDGSVSTNTASSPSDVSAASSGSLISAPSPSNTVQTPGVNSAAVTRILRWAE